MIKQVVLFLLGMLYSLGAASAGAGDWPRFRGPDRNDVSKETGLLTSWPDGGPKLSWAFREAGEGYSGMSVVGDRLYSCGGDSAGEHLYAIDLKTRKKVWSVKLGRFLKRPSSDSNGPCSTPTVDGRFVYALGSLGRLVCVDAAKGEIKWSVELSNGDQTHYGYVESPLIDGDHVVATPGGKAGAVAAFDKHTGALKWRCGEHTDMVRCGSAIATKLGGVRQYVQATQGHVIGVRPTDGGLLWRVTKPEAVAIVCQNDCIYISSSGDGELLRISPGQGNFKIKELYGRGKLRGNFGGVILVGNHLYGAGDGVWMCQDFSSGKLVWRKRSGFGNGSASVTFADGCLYGYWYTNGDVQLIQPAPAGFKEVGKFRVPDESRLRRSRPNMNVHPPDIWPRPVVANGKLYLRDHEVIFCYDVNSYRGR